MKKPSLENLQQELLNKKQPKTSQLIANPNRGERQDFRKFTITLSPALVLELRQEQVQRQAQGLNHYGISELIREALVLWLENKKIIKTKIS